MAAKKIKITYVTHIIFLLDRTALEQRSPTFLAPGTGFVEDNFSTDWEAGMGGMVQVVMQATGNGR